MATSHVDPNDADTPDILAHIGEYPETMLSLLNNEPMSGPTEKYERGVMREALIRLVFNCVRDRNA